MKFMINWNIPEDKWLPVLKKWISMSPQERANTGDGVKMIGRWLDMAGRPAAPWCCRARGSYVNSRAGALSKPPRRMAAPGATPSLRCVATKDRNPPDSADPDPLRRGRLRGIKTRSRGEGRPAVVGFRKRSVVVDD